MCVSECMQEMRARVRFVGVFVYVCVGACS